MRDAILCIKSFLEKNGLIKMIVAFVILIISVLAVGGNLSTPSNIVFAITGYISLHYVIVVGAIISLSGLLME